MISDNTTGHIVTVIRPFLCTYAGIRIGVEFTGGLPLSPLMKGCDEQYAEQTPVLTTAMLTLAAVVYTTSAFAETSKLVIESAHKVVGKRRWKKERGLLLAVFSPEVNTRAEKEWDKNDAAFDNRDKVRAKRQHQRLLGSPIRCGVWIVVRRSRYYALMQDN